MPPLRGVHRGLSYKSMPTHCDSFSMLLLPVVISYTTTTSLYDQKAAPYIQQRPLLSLLPPRGRTLPRRAPDPRLLEHSYWPLVSNLFWDNHHRRLSAYKIVGLFCSNPTTTRHWLLIAFKVVLGPEKLREAKSLAENAMSLLPNSPWVKH